MISSFQGIITEEWKIMGTVMDHVTGTCLTYANDSAVKREDTAWQEGRDVWWQDVVPKYPKESAVEWVDAEDTLFLLYTSGSTGKPKVCMFIWRTTTLNPLSTLFSTKS
jgi:acyl-coenzyme A synthetase/AMP-(fatty) acid ligase